MPPRPAPDPQPAPEQGLDEAAVRQLELRELQRLFESLAGLRMGAFVAMASLAALFLVFEGTSWKVVLLALASLVALGVALRKPPSLDQWHRLAFVFGAIYLFHTVMILVTGGIESPLIVLYLPVTIIMAISAGQRRLFLTLVALPTTAIWALTLVQILGPPPGLLPGLFHAGQTRYTSLYWVTFALALTVMMLVGGGLSLRVRHALDRAVLAASEARAETLALSQERNRELTQLLGALAHELKNPLACIQGLTGLVARQLPAGQKPAEQMGVVKEEVKRMGAIIEEFLTFSRPLQELAIERVELLALAREVTSLHEAEALRRQVTLHVEGPAGLEVRCDPRKLKQVLVNLLQNALDASPTGGQVTVRGDWLEADEGTSALLEIDDDGPGFGSAASRFFTPGLTTKSGGSGLGLTIARVIVEQHGGALRLGDRDGGGGRVGVTLPAHGPAMDDHTPAREPAHA